MMGNKNNQKNSFVSFVKDKWWVAVVAVGVIIFSFGIYNTVQSQKTKFQDTYSVMTKLPKKVDLNSPNGNFQASFKNGVIIKQIDDKKDLMRTSYVYQDGIIPTKRIIINTVEKVKITKNGKANYTIKPTGDLVALSASTNSVDKATTGFKNKQAQIKGSKEWISKNVGYIVNAKDTNLPKEVEKNLKVVKTDKGDNIVELQSGNMKSELKEQYKVGTPKNDIYKYDKVFLYSDNHKIRKASDKQLYIETTVFNRFN